MKKIWTYGISNFDVIAQPLERWPNFGELVVTDRTEFMPGGPAVNTAITLRRLGFERVGLVARFGDDRAGEMLRQELEKMGVDAGSVSVSTTSPTAVCIVCVHPGGERSFFYSFGGNNELGPDNADISRVEAGDFFHLGAAMGMGRSRAELIVPLLEELRQQKTTISADTSFDPAGAWWPSLAPCLPFIDVLFSNESEAAYLTGSDDPLKAAEIFHRAGAKTVALKLGGEGAYVLSPDWQGRVPPFRVDALDSTGAGDAFCGGFLYGLDRGWPAEQCALFANAVGALCVTAFGATTGIRDYSETLALIRSQGRAGEWKW